MPTLEEILQNDLGLGSEKVAQTKTTETNEIDKLAMEIGLIEGNDETEVTSQDNNGLNKEARMSLNGIYSDLFPGDEDIVSEKVASAQEESEEMSKEAAAAEEAIGERAADYFAHYVDAHIQKIAADVAEKMQHEIPGKLQDNEDKSEGAIGTDGNDGAEGEAAMGTNPQGAVGKFEMKNSPDGELKQAAVRKHMLKLMLGK